MIGKINSLDSLSFKGLCGRNYQTFSPKQQELIWKLELDLNKPFKKGRSSCMQELEKKNVDIYIKPAKNEEDLKISLIKRLKNNQIVRFYNFGSVDESKISEIPQKSVSKTNKGENIIKNLMITGGILVIAGLMSLLYVVQQKNTRPLQEAVKDSITLVKDSVIVK